LSIVAVTVACALSVVAAGKHGHHGSSSSDSSTDRNEHRKAFIAANIASFENRLDTAVSKALLDQNAALDVTPFLKTYGINSDRSFDKTFELLAAIVKENSVRKRNVLSSSDSISSSDAELERDIANSGVRDLLNSLNQDQKDQFRVAVLKQALAQHLQSGREQHDAENIGALLEEYEHWKTVNARIFKNPKAAKQLIGSRKDKKELFSTSSDKK